MEALKQIEDLLSMCDAFSEQLKLSNGLIADYKVYAQYQSYEIENLKAKVQFLKTINEALEITQFVRNDN